MEGNETNFELFDTSDTFDSTSEITKIYCSQNFQDFWNKLEYPFVYINLIICGFGVCANALSFLVYTRKTMRTQVVNVVLAGVALSDLIVMATYIPQFVGKLEFVKVEHPFYTAVAWILHEYFLAVFHHISIWFTATLGLLRYVAVVHPLKSKYLCTLRKTRLLMAIIIVLNLLITIPGYIDAYIEEDADLNYCGVKYCAKWRPINWLRQVEFWYQGFSKIFPAMWSAFVTISLVQALYQARVERSAMMENPEPWRQRQWKYMQQEITAESNTTRMLVVVFLVFLVTELPPSVLYILEIFFDKEFYFQCRRPMHYPILFMYYLSGALNFFVYITLSKKFRYTFLKWLGCESQISEKHNSKASVETGISKISKSSLKLEVA